MAERAAFTPVGDINGDEATIERRDRDDLSDFMIVTNDQPVAHYTTRIEGNTIELLAIFVLPDYRGQQFTEKFCWFLKTREQKDIVFGEHMSTDAFQLARKLAASGRFNLYWTKDGRRERFDPSEDINGAKDDEQHVALDGPTGWRLVAEHASQPQRHFTRDRWMLGESYDLFDDLDYNRLVGRGLTISQARERLV